MTAAALGTTLTLPTLEADSEPDTGVETSFELDVKPGTQSGSEHTLPRTRGSGAAGRPR